MVSVVPVVVSCPVLSCPLVVPALVLSLGVILSGSPETGQKRAETGQNRPEKARKRAKRGTKTPYIYILYFRSAKNQSFVSDNMPYKAFRGRITQNFDISL